MQYTRDGAMCALILGFFGVLLARVGAGKGPPGAWLPHGREVRRLLSASRLVTLTGVGGVGKTRLAQRVAAQVRRAFPNGTWFVDLAELRDPERPTHRPQDPQLVAHQVAAAMGLQEPGIGRPCPLPRRTRPSCRRLQASTDHLPGRGSASPATADPQPARDGLRSAERHAQAVAYLQDALTITEPRGELWHRSISLSNLATALWRQGDHGRAVETTTRGLRLKRLIGDRRGTGLCLEVLAWAGATGTRCPARRHAFGAAKSLSQAVDVPTNSHPTLIALHQKWEQCIRHVLGERGFEATFRRGMELNLEEATAYAVNERCQPSATRPASDADILTPRERQAAGLIAQGLTNKGIAAELMISQRTAESHVEHILAKLQFTSRAQIAAAVAPNQASPHIQSSSEQT
jgi:DNA-binding CsgD family transcriptional regulator